MKLRVQAPSSVVGHVAPCLCFRPLFGASPLGVLMRLGPHRTGWQAISGTRGRISVAFRVQAPASVVGGVAPCAWFGALSGASPLIFVMAGLRTVPFFGPSGLLLEVFGDLRSWEARRARRGMEQGESRRGLAPFGREGRESRSRNVRRPNGACTRNCCGVPGTGTGQRCWRCGCACVVWTAVRSQSPVGHVCPCGAVGAARTGWQAASGTRGRCIMPLSGASPLGGTFVLVMRLGPHRTGWQAASGTRRRDTGWQAASGTRGRDTGWQAASGTRGRDTGWQAASGTRKRDTGWQAASGTRKRDTGWQAASGTRGRDTGWQAASGTRGRDTGWQAASGTRRRDTGWQAASGTRSRISVGFWSPGVPGTGTVQRCWACGSVFVLQTAVRSQSPGGHVCPCDAAGAASHWLASSQWHPG